MNAIAHLSEVATRGGVVLLQLTVGCRRGSILLPTGYGQWPTERSRVVLAHEMAHILRRDVLWQLIAQLTGCLYWHHPLVWLANWRMRVEREFACDDAVLAMGEIPGHYARQLVDVAAEMGRRPRPLRSAVAMAGLSGVERRIRAILHPGAKRTPVTRCVGQALAAGALAIVVAISLMLPSTSHEANASPQTDDDPPAVSADAETTKDSNEKANKKTNKRRNNKTSQKTGKEPNELPAAMVESASPTASTSVAGKYAITMGSMQIRVLAPDGRPMPGAKIHTSVWTKEPIKANRYVSDAKGLATVALPKKLTILRVWARKDSYVPLFAQWWPKKQSDGHRIPREFTFRLQQGTVIGGVVKNEQAEPIEGVKVEVMRESGGIRNELKAERPDLGTWLAEGDDGARMTDANGYWTLDNVPAGENVKIRVKLSHPDYIDDGSWGGLQKEQRVTMKSLRDQTAKIVMRKGISVTGTVTDPMGELISGAVVIWGDRPYFQTGSQEVRTDAKGVFRFPPLPPGPMTVTVVAQGWRPALRKIDIQPKFLPVDFQLKPGKLLRVRLIDDSGAAVPDVHVQIGGWRGGESLYNHKHPNVLETKIPRKSDENGIFEWTWAPDDEVTYRFSKQGHAWIEARLTANGKWHVITFHPRLNVSGTVTDAKTGMSINGFRAVPVIYFRPDFLYVNRSDAVDGRDGRFAIEFDRTDIEHGLRIEAEGYRTQRFGPWKIGDPNVVLNVKLDPASPLQGVLLDGKGQPVPEANVYLATHTQHLDIANRQDDDEDTFFRKTDAQGQFTFPAQHEPYTIIVIHKAGYAEVSRSKDEQPGRLQLRAWARVEGRLLQAGQPVPGQQVRLGPIRPRFYPQPRIEDALRLDTDAEGRFVFKRVPPVKSALMADLSVWRESPLQSSQSVPLDLQPGQTVTIDLNGAGTEVTGRVVLKGNTQQEIDLNYSLNYLVARRNGIQPPRAVAEKGFDWRNGWSDAWSSSLEGQAYKSTLHHYFVKLNRDGTFRISGVPPGEYELALTLYEPPEGGCLVQPVATHQLRFKVPDDDFKPTLDLGEVEVEAVLGPRPGDVVPDFTFETLEGGKKSLNDFRGRYVMIDVWATWCAPCVASLPKMVGIHKQLADNDRIVVLGLNLDRDGEKARQFVRQRELPWQHGFLGDWSETDVPLKFGISSIPAYLFIDPAGRLVHKAYQLDAITPLVRNALKSRTP